MSFAGLVLQVGQLSGDVAGDHDPAGAGVVIHGDGEDDLGQSDQQVGELLPGRPDSPADLRRAARGDLLPVGHDELVNAAAHRPGVGRPEGVVDEQGLWVTEHQRLPEETGADPSRVVCMWTTILRIGCCCQLG
jgi:hypothetical protein